MGRPGGLLGAGGATVNVRTTVNVVLDIGVFEGRGAGGGEWDDRGGFWVLAALVERVLPAYYSDLSGVVRDVRARLALCAVRACVCWGAGVGGWVVVGARASADLGGHVLSYGLGARAHTHTHTHARACMRTRVLLAEPPRILSHGGGCPDPARDSKSQRAREAAQD